MVVYNPIIMDSYFITLLSLQLSKPIGMLIGNSTRLERDSTSHASTLSSLA